MCRKVYFDLVLEKIEIRSKVSGLIQISSSKRKYGASVVNAERFHEAIITASHVHLFYSLRSRFVLISDSLWEVSIYFLESPSHRGQIDKLLREKCVVEERISSAGYEAAWQETGQIAFMSYV